MAEEMGLYFFCNTMTGHVILLFEVQKKTEINLKQCRLSEYISQFIIFFGIKCLQDTDAVPLNCGVVISCLMQFKNPIMFLEIAFAYHKF